MLRRHGREDPEPPTPTLKDITKVMKDLTPIPADTLIAPPVNRKRAATTLSPSPVTPKRPRTSGHRQTTPEMGRHGDGSTDPFMSSPMVEDPSKDEDVGGMVADAISGLDLGGFVEDDGSQIVVMSSTSNIESESGVETKVEVEDDEEDEDDQAASALEESLSLIQRLIELAPSVQEEIAGEGYVAMIARGAFANLRTASNLTLAAGEVYLMEDKEEDWSFAILWWQ